MKKILPILFVLMYQLSFGQAREYDTRDTITHLGGQITKDTIQIVSTDTTIRRYNETRYAVTLGVNPNMFTSSGSSSNLWLQSQLYPSKIYYDAGSVGIGTGNNPLGPLQIARNTTSQNTQDTGILLTNSNTTTPTSTLNNYGPGIYFQSNSSSSTPAITATGYKPTIRQVPYSTYGPAALPHMKWEYFEPSGATWNQMMKLTTGTVSNGVGLTVGTGISTSGIMNFNLTPYQIDNNSSGNPLLIGNGNGGITLNTNFYMNGSGVVYQAPYNTTAPAFAVNDYSAQTFARAGTIGDFQVRANSLKGFGLPLMLGGVRDSMTSRVTGWTITNGGSGYPSGNNNSTATTAITGIGSGASAFLVVSSGVITGVGLSVAGADGKNYKVGDQVSIPAYGGTPTGSGGILTVASISTFSQGISVVDTSTNQVSYHIGTGNNWTGRVVSTNTATYNPLAYGADYVFTGSTASYDLPAVNSKISGRQNEIHIINEGSGSITVNSNTGSTIYTTSLQASITIAAGATAVLFPTGSNFKVKFNQ